VGMPPTGPPKYEPLRRYLVALPADVTTVTLTVAEIEALLGASLPASARTSSWWANSQPVAHRRAWLTIGWRVMGHTFRPAVPTVTFTRVASPP
jgi:hypothetical protein